VNATPVDEAGLGRWEAVLADGGFEEVYTALAEVVELLEDGGLALDASVTLFEMGSRLADRCDGLLDQAELRVGKIEGLADRLDGADAPDRDPPRSRFRA